MSDENINSIKTPNHSITQNLSYYGTQARVESDRSCLKQIKVTFNYGKLVNICIVYEISKDININDYPTLESCLFGAVTLTKNADINKYKYSRYGTGFDRHRSFSFPGSGFRQNFIIFGVDLCSSTKIDNRTKDILILGKDPTQGLEHTH